MAKSNSTILDELAQALESYNEKEIANLLEEIEIQVRENKNLIRKTNLKILELEKLKIQNIDFTKLGLLGAQNLLRLITKALKLKGLNQTQTGGFHKQYFSNEKYISQPKISLSLKSKDIDEVVEMIESTHEVYQMITDQPDILLSYRTSGSEYETKSLLRSEKLVTWPTIVNDFVAEQIGRHSIETPNEILFIEAIGMKLSSLYKTLKVYIDNKKLPECKIDLVVIDPDGSGLLFRNIMEFSNDAYVDDIKAGFIYWKGLMNAFENKVELNNSKIKMRFLKPDPNFYMIKINDHMLTSVYLRDPGNTSHFTELDSNLHPKKFQDYYNAFLQYFENDGLSSDCNWNHPIFDRSKPLVIKNG